MQSGGVVGRDADLEILADLRGAAAGGRGGVVVVVGEAGIGKSALVRAGLPATGVVVGRSTPPPSAALAPLVEWAAGMVAAGARSDSALLGPHRTVLGAVLSGDGGETLGAHAHPVVLGDALLKLWSTVPVPRRPVLVAEDVQWTDDGAWVAVQRVIVAAPAAGAAVVLTSRPGGAVWPSVQRLFDTRAAARITLGPLGERDVAAMVADRLGTGEDELPAGLLERISVAGGHPLLVEEVLADLLRSDVLVDTADGWTLGPGRARVPETLDVSVRVRMEAMSLAGRRFAGRAAVLGGDVDAGLVGESFGMSPDEVGSAVHDCVDAGLLVVEPGSGRPGFRHELIRDAVLGGLLDVQRRAHAEGLLELLGHGRVAGWDRDLPDGRLALAARLADVAAEPDLAAVLHLSLSRRLLDRGLPLAAATAAEASATWEPTRSEALSALVEALALAGEVDRALAAADDLDARTGVEPESRVREAVARAVAEQGDWERAEVMVTALRCAGESPSLTALAALVAVERGRYEQADAEARRVLATVREGAPACEAMVVLGRLARRSDLAAAQAWFRRSVAAAEAGGLGLWRARALHEVATIAQLRTLDLAPLRAARQAAVDVGAPGLVSSVDFHLAAVHGVRFEAADALRTARTLLVEARRSGARGQEAWAWVLIGQAHAVGGARAQAAAAADEAIRCAENDLEVRGLALGVCRGLASLLAEDAATGVEQWRAAIEALRAFPRTGPMPPWYLWPILATVLDVEGDGGTRARAETAGPDIRAGTGAEATWWLAAAVAAGRDGDEQAAAAAAARAETLFTAIPDFVGWRHLANRWVAQDAITAGWGTPATWMTEAQRWLDEKGFPAAAGACRGLARRAGAPQRRRGRGRSAVPAHLERLGVTSREVDVLRLVAEGLTNAEIAERLYLSPRTVKGYVEQLLAKTGAANRTQLARRLAAGPAR